MLRSAVNVKRSGAGFWIEHILSATAESKTCLILSLKTL